MHAFGIWHKVITLNTSISICGEAAQWQHALHLLHLPAGHGLDAITFNSTLSAVSANEDGRWLLSSLLLAALHGHQLSSDVMGYTAAITSCEQGSLWPQAAALFAEMLDQRIQADSLSVSLVTTACQKQDAWQQILSLLHDQRAQLVAINILTYNLAMSACLQEWQYVLALLESLRAEAIHANAITYSRCLDACEKGRQLASFPVFSRALDLQGLHAVCVGACKKGRCTSKFRLCMNACSWRISYHSGPPSALDCRCLQLVCDLLVTAIDVGTTATFTILLPCKDPALPLPRQGEGTGDSSLSILTRSCIARLQGGESRRLGVGRVGPREQLLLAMSEFRLQARRRFSGMMLFGQRWFMYCMAIRL